MKTFFLVCCLMNKLIYFTEIFLNIYRPIRIMVSVFNEILYFLFILFNHHKLQFLSFESHFFLLIDQSSCMELIHLFPLFIKIKKLTFQIKYEKKYIL